MVVFINVLAEKFLEVRFNAGDSFQGFEGVIYGAASTLFHFSYHVNV
jgi:hypothetical protein